MPERVPTILSLGNGARRITWAGLGSGDTGAWVNVAGLRSLTVTIEGTTVTTIALQGSNQAENANPRTLEDEDGTAITAAGIFKVKETPLSVRPSVTTGTAITVSLVATP